MYSHSSRSRRYETSEAVRPGNSRIVEPIDRPAFLAIARITRPRGNRGEVIADLCTDFPERFNLLRQVWLEFGDQHRERVLLEACWMQKGRPVLKFAGIDSISEAERLAGTWVEVESAEATPLPYGSYFDHDLVGCSVTTIDGRILGRVTDILRIAGNSQLVVEDGQVELLIPAVEAFCKQVSIATKEILVDIPEGLIELNR
jgi:16S rRNA processing protein RimM